VEQELPVKRPTVAILLLGFAGCLSASSPNSSPKEATERAFAAALVVGEAEPPCRETIGKGPALALVRYCRWYSTATHPPCNTANHCAIIVDHIRKMCRSEPDGPDRPLPCGGETSADEWERIGRMPAN
jgi:hypothetical protein